MSFLKRGATEGHVRNIHNGNKSLQKYMAYSFPYLCFLQYNTGWIAVCWYDTNLAFKWCHYKPFHKSSLRVAFWTSPSKFVVSLTWIFRVSVAEIHQFHISARSCTMLLGQGEAKRQNSRISVCVVIPNECHLQGCSSDVTHTPGSMNK